jgi:hypothetical protein
MDRLRPDKRAGRPFPTATMTGDRRWRSLESAEFTQEY